MRNALLIFCALSLSPLARAHGPLYAPDGTYLGHEEKGVQLPFDPLFCDINKNEFTDAEEIRPDNICDQSGKIFTPKPIATLGLNKGELILTTDDGPNPSITPALLDLLDEYKIPNTFFVVGSLIANNAEIIRDQVSRGHLVGNHTFSHPTKVNSETLVAEVLKADKALRTALGFTQSRLLFRAPGLNWSEPKSVALNDNAGTKNYIGPIHANIGTDQPRADWSCWSTGKSSAQCADFYYQDILAAGKGIILSHDVYYKPGRGNTYEMLKILLHRLDTEGGGITNRHGGKGVWTFVGLKGNKFLDRYETKKKKRPKK